MASSTSGSSGRSGKRSGWFGHVVQLSDDRARLDRHPAEARRRLSRRRVGVHAAGDVEEGGVVLDLVRDDDGQPVLPDRAVDLAASESQVCEVSRSTAP